MAYDPDTKKEARELFELGLSYEQIAEKLEIPRWMTVYDWARESRKNGDPWTRKNSIKDEELILFRMLRFKAKTYLETADFNSPAEALRIYKEVSTVIKAAEKLDQGKVGKKETPSVMKALNIDEESSKMEKPATDEDR